MATVYGIDISKWQGDPDFSKVKTDPKAQFIIMRAGIGTATDVKYERNYSECKKHGIPCGAYWYSKALTPAAARSEAKACIKALSGKQFEYPIWFDIEEKSALATGKNNCTAMCKAFCEEMERHGYWVGIYASRSVIESYIDADTQSKYSIWAAEWGDKLRYHGTAAIWQNSEKGRVNGISGNVDLDECYVDYPALIVGNGFNGFPKPEPIPYLPETKPSDIDFGRIPYIHGMNAGRVQTYIKWVTCLGAGDYQDTREDFLRYLSENA